MGIKKKETVHLKCIKNKENTYYLLDKLVDV